MNDITGGRYCYPGTNVLINKYSIHDGDIQPEDEKGSEEQYQISKSEYELFKEKYRISKK